jgi:hypothetical protein
MSQHAAPGDFKIAICVRKRPVSSKEVHRRDYDAVTCLNPRVVVHACKLKVDGITKVLENSPFEFDHVSALAHRSGCPPTVTCLSLRPSPAAVPCGNPMGCCCDHDGVSRPLMKATTLRRCTGTLWHPLSNTFLTRERAPASRKLPRVPTPTHAPRQSSTTAFAHDFARAVMDSPTPQKPSMLRLVLLPESPLHDSKQPLLPSQVRPNWLWKDAHHDGHPVLCRASTYSRRRRPRVVVRLCVGQGPWCRVSLQVLDRGSPFCKNCLLGKEKLPAPAPPPPASRLLCAAAKRDFGSPSPTTKSTVGVARISCTAVTRYVVAAVADSPALSIRRS